MTDVICVLESSVLRISLSGPLDRHASVKIQEHVNQYQLNQYSTIIFDLSDVSIIDSPGLELLFFLSRIMRRHNGELCIRNSQTHVRDMLSRIDISTLAKLDGDSDSALTAA